MKPLQIPLGFAVPSGDPIAIPLGHMAVTGQTQAAGKTTTLEALAARSDRPVLAFRTKRGEGAFVDCRTHPPIFRERADWQFVQAVLEATMRERMKFERGWIMRACKGATTLQDVQRNVKQLMGTAKGLSADVYYQLDHYLDIVIPQIRGARFVARLGLVRGINVIDLGSFTLEMQALVLQSALAYVYGHLDHTIVIIPEAWEFLPRARKSPVTLAAEELIRKGAALQNYLWIDSQDLAGVHTPILKSIHVWLLGVQREINEVKRTLAHVHGVKKPTVDAIAALGLGQFIACFGQQAVTTYVRPIWLAPEDAVAIATGVAPAELLRGDAERAGVKGIPYVSLRGRSIPTEIEDLMDIQLKADNDQLRQENVMLHKRIAELEAAVREAGVFVGEKVLTEAGVPLPPRRAGTTPLHGRPLDENGGIEFTKPTQANFQRDFSGRGARITPATAPVTAADNGLPENWLQQVREKILQDADVQAALVKIMAVRPEIVVELHPKTVTIDGDSPRGRLAKMIAQGLLDQPVKPGVIVKEFARTGQSVHPSRLSEYLADFMSMGIVTREESGTYQKAPGVVVGTKVLEAV